MLLVLTAILAVLLLFLYVDIWFYVQARPPQATVDAPVLPPENEIPLFPDLQFGSIVKTRDIYSYEDMLQDLHNMIDQYPLLTVDIIGSSVEGRAVYLLKLGHGPKKILIDGSHHGNEWISSFLLMTMAEHYAYYYHSGQPSPHYDVRQLLSEVTLYFVPMLNPDGIEIVANDGKHSPRYEQLVYMNGGSHNFINWKANAQGVDLNRQYPTNWHMARDYGPKMPSRANYAGPHALSEPEVQAIDRLHRQELFDVQVSYHSMGNVLYYYYHQQGEQLARDLQLVQLVSNQTGYPIRHSSGGIGGLARDHMVQEYGIPSLIVELGRQKPRPLLEFHDMWRRNQEVPLLIADWVRKQQSAREKMGE